MTIYEKNIHTLAKYYPGMDHNIEKARKELKEELDLIEELSAELQRWIANVRFMQ